MYNENLDFIHNIYGFIYCIQMFYLNMLIIFSNSETNYLSHYYYLIFVYSLFYFTISTGINYLDKNPIYIIHHVICLIMLYYGYIYEEPEYLIWMSKTFMAEFSTIFLSLSKMLRYGVKNNINIPKEILSYSDNFFIISYFCVRIFYLLPLCLHFIITYKFVGIFSFIIPFICVIMIIMNLYWSFLIYKKISRNIDLKIIKKKLIKSIRN